MADEWLNGLVDSIGTDQFKARLIEYLERWHEDLEFLDLADKFATDVSFTALGAPKFCSDKAVATVILEFTPMTPTSCCDVALPGSEESIHLNITVTADGEVDIDTEDAGMYQPDGDYY